MVNTKNINTLLLALSDLNLVLKKEPKKVVAMWECPDTKILFHGNEFHDMNINFDKYSEEDFLPYKEELISRISHLKNKFLNQLQDDKKH